MWPFKPKVKKTARPNTSKFKEQDKNLLDQKELKKDDVEFKKESGFLHDLLNKFRKR